MDQRRLGWNDMAGGPEPEAYEQDGQRSGSLLPALPETADHEKAHDLIDGERRALARSQPAPRIRSVEEFEMREQQAPRTVDRSEMTSALNEALEVDPRRTAVITIDCHRGHLDLAVATMPIAPQAAASVVASSARLLRFARTCGMYVIHVVSQHRILPEGQPELLCNPFWAAVEGTRQSLTPDRESTISRHNLVGTVQTQLMPELGPEPGDILIDRKRRLSIYRDTDLDLTLREVGVDTVVLVGINTNTTVLCAAFESLNRDLTTIVVSDCVDSMYGEDLHFFALQNVARCLGWVLTVDELAARVEPRRAIAAR